MCALCPDVRVEEVDVVEHEQLRIGWIGLLNRHTRGKASDSSERGGRETSTSENGASGTHSAVSLLLSNSLDSQLRVSSSTDLLEERDPCALSEWAEIGGEEFDGLDRFAGHDDRGRRAKKERRGRSNCGAHKRRDSDGISARCEDLSCRLRLAAPPAPHATPSRRCWFPRSSGARCVQGMLRHGCGDRTAAEPRIQDLRRGPRGGTPLFLRLQPPWSSEAGTARCEEERWTTGGLQPAPRSAAAVGSPALSPARLGYSHDTTRRGQGVQWTAGAGLAVRCAELVCCGRYDC